MKQLTFDNITPKLTKLEYHDQIICQCGHYHVYGICPVCGVSREESLMKETYRNFTIIYGASP
jgi:hypothetical protein